MANVVVTGTDGTEGATAAGMAAAKVARALGAELVIVMAADKVDLSDVGAPGDSDRLITPGEAADRIVEQAVRDLRADYPDLQISTRIEGGKAADALVRVAEDLNAELIVVGNKRVQGVARVLGSIATDVAHHAPCDVYIAHTH